MNVLADLSQPNKTVEIRNVNMVSEFAFYLGFLNGILVYTAATIKYDPNYQR